MAAPGGKELDQNNSIRIQNLALEVGRGELNHRGGRPVQRIAGTERERERDDRAD